MGRISDTRVAFSVHFYRYTTTTTDGLVRIPTASGRVQIEDAKQSAFSAIPSSFCAFFTLRGIIPEESEGWLKVVRGSSGRTKLGLCGATIERESVSLTAEHRNVVDPGVTTAANLDSESSWQRHSFGPSVSYQLTDGLSVGTSLHLVSTSSRQSHDLALLSGPVGSSQQIATYLHQTTSSSLDGTTTLGATFALRGLTSGLSLRLPSVHFSDSARLTRFESPTTGNATLGAAKGHLDAPLPPVLTIGSGVEWENHSLELDLAVSLGKGSGFRTSLDEQSTTSDTGAVTKRHSVVDAAGRTAVSLRVGGEWYLSPSLSLLGGARYEPSRVVASSRDAAYQIAPTDASILATSVGLGSYGRGTELLIGTEMSYGWGRIPISIPSLSGTSYSLADQRTWSALFVISGSIGLSSVRQTFTNFKELSPEEKPAPVKPPAPLPAPAKQTPGDAVPNDELAQ
jgi:hypothetical protein